MKRRAFIKAMWAVLLAPAAIIRALTNSPEHIQISNDYLTDNDVWGLKPSHMVDKIAWVGQSGSDETGDGSFVKPYFTIEYALGSGANYLIGMPTPHGTRPTIKFTKPLTI